MLNRTNRTLSANTNRLDLGTRDLAAIAGDNNGNLTLRTAQTVMVVVVRAGVVEHPGIPMEGSPIPAGPKRMKPAMSAMPGSSPRPPRPARGYRAWDQGPFAVLSSPIGRPLAGPVGGVTPRSGPSQGQPGSSPGWRCRRARFAGRPARAAMALVTGALPAR